MDERSWPDRGLDVEGARGLGPLVEPARSVGFSDTMHRLAGVSNVSIHFARVSDYIGDR